MLLYVSRRCDEAMLPKNSQEKVELVALPFMKGREIRGSMGSGIILVYSYTTTPRCGDLDRQLLQTS